MFAGFHNQSSLLTMVREQYWDTRNFVSKRFTWLRFSYLTSLVIISDNISWSWSWSYKHLRCFWCFLFNLFFYFVPSPLSWWQRCHVYRGDNPRSSSCHESMYTTFSSGFFRRFFENRTNVTRTSICLFKLSVSGLVLKTCILLKWTPATVLCSLSFTMNCIS